jgi:hypothetical protein
MRENTAAVASSSESSETSEPWFERIEETLREEGAGAALDRLASVLDAQGNFRALLDALLLKARFDLDMPLVPTGSLADLPEPLRSRFEERYVEAIRRVGRRYLDIGDIPTAWAYYRVLGELEPVAEAIAGFTPGENDERLGQIIEVAFNHGASPRRGFELILEHYGTCPAISAFEQLPPNDAGLRAYCAERLIGRLHRDLVANLRSEIAARGQLVPPEGTSIPALLNGREWLFGDEAYHVDTSHLSAVVRFSALVTDPRFQTLAVDLCEYGKRLSPRLQFEGAAPFQNVFEDHRVYLNALLGHDVEAAVAHFRAKLDDDSEGLGSDPTLPAQVFVNLLVQLERFDDAIDVAAEHFAGRPDSTLSCPSAAALCLRAGKPERLAQIARDQDNLVDFTAALLAGEKRER